jgi:hypothetical protein
MNPQVTELSLYDIAGTKGVAADVSHVNTKAKTQVGARATAGRGARRSGHPQQPCHCALQGFEGADSLGDALKGCDLVIIPAGVPRKPGMTRDDLFKVGPRPRTAWGCQGAGSVHQPEALAGQPLVAAAAAARGLAGPRRAGGAPSGAPQISSLALLPCR